MVTEVAAELAVESGFSEGSELALGSSAGELGTLDPRFFSILPAMSTNISWGWVQSGEARGGWVKKRRCKGRRIAESGAQGPPLSL